MTHILKALVNHLDSPLPAGKAAAPGSAVLDLLTGGWPSSRAGVPTLRCAHRPRHILVLVNIVWLDERVGILNKWSGGSGLERVVC